MCRLILLLVFIFSNAQEYFNITRQPSTLWDDVPDVFRIPPSWCGGSKSSEDCLQMGGNKIGNCQCKCNTAESIDNRSVAYKSTFGFFGGKWKCVNNSLLRKQAGCLRLTDELYDPIKTMSRTISSTKSLTVLIVDNSTSCTIERLIADNSSYLDCQGKWKFFNGSSRFNLTKYGVQFNSEFDRLEPRLEGLIIRLGVKCINRSSVSCILLKLDGHQICSLPSPSPSPSSSPLQLLSAVVTTTLPLVSTPNSTSCGKECKKPTSPSKLHTIIIGILLAASVLVVIITASVLMKKARTNTRIRRKRKMRQPLVPQMSAPTENNEHGQSHVDVDEIDQENQEDGYLYPIDNFPISDKSYGFDKLDSKEIDDNAERSYVEESSGPSIEEHYERTNSNTLQNSQNVRKLNSTLQSPSSDSPSECNGYKPSITAPNPNISGRSLTISKNVSKGEPIYHILEDPGAGGDNTLQNRSCDSMEINQQKPDNVYNEVGEITTKKVSENHNYQELHFDGKRLPHVYQSLCIEKKS